MEDVRSAKQVAKLFLAWACEDGDLLTNLKLQKLLYYAQAWHLVNFQKPIFRDPLRAWALGPVVSSIYADLKKYGATPIPYKPSGSEDDPFAKSQLAFLRECYVVFSNFSASQLVSMSHNELPWIDTWNDGMGMNCEISHASMKKFYSELYRKSNGKTKV